MKGTWLFVAILLCLGLPKQSGAMQFISSSNETKKASRIEVKQAFGHELQQQLRTSACVQKKVGELLGGLADVNTVIADQAEKVLDDAEPFSSASTKRLERAVKENRQLVAQVERKLAKLSLLMKKMQKIALLENE